MLIPVIAAALGGLIAGLNLGWRARGWHEADRRGNPVDLTGFRR